MLSYSSVVHDNESGRHGACWFGKRTKKSKSSSAFVIAPARAEPINPPSSSHHGKLSNFSRKMSPKTCKNSRFDVLSFSLGGAAHRTSMFLERSTIVSLLFKSERVMCGSSGCTNPRVEVVGCALLWGMSVVVEAGILTSSAGAFVTFHLTNRICLRSRMKLRPIPTPKQKTTHSTINEIESECCRFLNICCNAKATEK